MYWFVCPILELFILEWREYLSALCGVSQPPRPPATSSSNVASLLEKALQGCFGPAKVPSFSGNLRSDTPASKRDPQFAELYVDEKTMPYFV